jgi:MFS family permease
MGMAQEQRRSLFVVASLFIALLLILGPTSNTLSFYFAAFVKLFGWTHAQVSLLATCFSLAMGLSAPIAGWLLDRFDASFVMGSGAVLVIAGLLMASQAHSLGMVLWAYVLIGGGVGCSTMIPASVVATNWFRHRRGLALASTLAGAAAASVTMPLVISHLLLVHGTRTTLAISAVPIIVLVLPLVLFIVRTRPPELFEDRKTGEERSGTVAGLEFSQALRTAPFWLLVAVQVCYGAGFGGFHYHFVPMFLHAGYSQNTAAIMMSITSAVAVASFFLVGMAADRYGGRATLAWSMALLGAGVALFGGISYRPAAVPILISALAMVGLFVGAAPIAGPILLVETLGLRRFGSLLGLLNFCSLVGFAIGPVLVGRMFDRTATYLMAMQLCGAICAAGAIAAAAAFPAPGHDALPQQASASIDLTPSEARSTL